VKVQSLYGRALTPSYQARRLFIAQKHRMNCSVFVTENFEVVHKKIFQLQISINNTFLLGLTVLFCCTESAPTYAAVTFQKVRRNSNCGQVEFEYTNDQL
jgi:hypothetical protein